MFASVEEMAEHMALDAESYAEQAAASVVRQLGQDGIAVSPFLQDAIAWRIMKTVIHHNGQIEAVLARLSAHDLRPRLRAVH